MAIQNVTSAVTSAQAARASLAMPKNETSAVTSAQDARAATAISKLQTKEQASDTSKSLKDLQFDTVTFSQEAKNLFADKSKTDSEAIQGLVNKTMDLVRDRYAKQAEPGKAPEMSALNNKIGDSKERLDDLLAKMRESTLEGDRRGAAKIEKEVVQLFNSL